MRVTSQRCGGPWRGAAGLVLGLAVIAPVLGENGKPKKPELAKDYKAPEDLEDRLLLPLLNEAVACLHDGVVADAELLDAGVIFGTGFAPFRGGPIQHIRDTGAEVLLARLKALQAKHGDRFAPRAGWDSPLLRADAVAIA